MRTPSGCETSSIEASVKGVGRHFRICTPSVVSEVIDGEAVIMDLRSGNYFSAVGTASRIWQDIEAGRSYEQVIDRLSATYRIDSATLSGALDRFLAELIANNLIEEAGETPAGNAEPASSYDIVPGEPFAPPVLAVFTDMQDLLLLDPIHDVDASGWPTRKA
jgi:Coenzyme PQQ synthesis protein D (PqqD)